MSQVTQKQQTLLIHGRVEGLRSQVYHSGYRVIASFRNLIAGAAS